MFQSTSRKPISPQPQFLSSANNTAGRWLFRLHSIQGGPKNRTIFERW